MVATGPLSIAAGLLTVAVASTPYCDKYAWYYPWGNSSRLSNVLGLGAGGLLLLFYRVVLNAPVPLSFFNFNQKLFFVALLPFIIFSAGFSFKRVMFFSNAGVIMTLGILGTLLAFLILSLGIGFAMSVYDFDSTYNGEQRLQDVLILGATFSATDTVAVLQLLNQDEYPMIFSLMFGEGVVNDAVAVVLAQSISNMGSKGIDVEMVVTLLLSVLYLFLASVVVGVLFGFLTAYLVRRLFTLPRQQSPAYEVGLMLVLAFMSYYVSMLMGLSGITTIFFCGIMDAHYTWYNLNDLAKISSRQFAMMMSNISELSTFILVGLDTMNPQMWARANIPHVVGMAAVLMVMTGLSRAAVIYPISALANKCRPRFMNIPAHYQHMLFYGGLIRGSVTVALAYHELGASVDENGVPDDSENASAQALRATLLAASLVTVQFSILVVGVFTKPVMAHLLKDDAASHNVYQFVAITPSGAYNGYQAPVESDVNMQSPLIPRDGTQPDAECRAQAAEEEEEQVCCLPLRKYMKVCSMFRDYDRRVLQKIFGGRYAAAPRTQLDSSLAGAFAELNADFGESPHRQQRTMNAPHPYQPLRSGVDTMRREHS
mmetsp:Transcript_28795/g.63063  ORF Transcript_28795/g.63063 Transcript_28795/m.63063 type:complete len:600 (-) Transcript_28795:475-2274(-)